MLAVKPSPFTSLKSRILVALVAIGFLSAIFSGIFYQLEANQTINQNLEAYRGNSLSRLENSRLPQAIKEQVATNLELRSPVTISKTVADNSLAQSIWVVALVAFGAALLASIVGWLLPERIVRPLAKLRMASQRAAQGDFSQRVAVEKNDEVGQVAYSFNFMAAELQGAETKRRQLLSSVAHELKTPLASIQGHVEALRDNIPQAKANPEAIYEIVLEDVAELDQMVSSLRSWLNGQSLIDNLEIKSLNLAEELPTIIERLRTRAEAATIQLKIQLNPQAKQVLADSRALKHIVSNLLDNALRYTPANGEIKLLAWCGEDERPSPKASNWVTLAVADTGCGIASEHWPHLFERFYRVAQTRTRDTGGTGLGLALVKDLTETMHGRVWLRSQVGHGTVFFVTLPAPQ
jgi:signal transduction histidine kinase